MKKAIIIQNKTDGSIKNIEYKYYDICEGLDKNQFDLELSSSEASAYWWIRRLKKLMRFLVDRQNNFKYNEYRDVLAIIGRFTEIEYRELYLKLTEMYNRRLSLLSSNENIEIGTKKGEHACINEVIEDLLIKKHFDENIVFPDVDLTTGFDDNVVISTLKNNALVCTSDIEPKHIQCSFTGDFEYDYVLSGDNTRLQFSNLIKAVMITLAKWEKLDTLSLNRICNGFYMGYVDHYGCDVDRDALVREFKNAFWTLVAGGFAVNFTDNTSFSLKITDNNEFGDKSLVYHANPIDENGLDGYYDLAAKIAGVICLRKIDRQRLSKMLRER